FSRTYPYSVKMYAHPREQETKKHGVQRLDDPTKEQIGRLFLKVWRETHTQWLEALKDLSPNDAKAEETARGWIQRELSNDMCEYYCVFYQTPTESKPRGLKNLFYKWAMAAWRYRILSAKTAGSTVPPQAFGTDSNYGVL